MANHFYTPDVLQAAQLAKNSILEKRIQMKEKVIEKYSYSTKKYYFFGPLIAPTPEVIMNRIHNSL